MIQCQALLEKKENLEKMVEDLYNEISYNSIDLEYNKLKEKFDKYKEMNEKL